MDWPKNLIKDIARRRAVLFFGSGISQNCFAIDKHTRPKSWIVFLQEALKGVQDKKVNREVKKLIRQNDLLTACEVIKREIGRANFIELVKSEFQAPGYVAAPIHDHLWKLDLKITITPNFDNIYETYVAPKSNGTFTTKIYNDNDIADSLRRDERVLIKSHGTITKPNDLIFTRVDYAKARNENGEFYELLDSLLRTHTFLFVGCGIDDPDIRLLLENYCFRHRYAQNHYFAIANNRLSIQTKEVLEETLKIEFIEYKYTADHINLTNGIADLVKEVELKRDEIGKSQNW